MKRQSPHTRRPDSRPVSFTDVVIRHTSPEGLEKLRQLVLRCPLSGAKEIADRLNAGIQKKTCGTRADESL